jgi:SAM-dependent methyltransferase
MPQSGQRGYSAICRCGIDAEPARHGRELRAQWQVFDELEEHHEGQFRDWIAPVTPEFIRGRTVIEAGCGKGRHTRALARWGAREVVSVDLSEAVEVAYRNTRDLPNVHIVQADIYRLPLRPIFDYGLSVGVLHHLPIPRRFRRAG